VPVGLALHLLGRGKGHECAVFRVARARAQRGIEREVNKAVNTSQWQAAAAVYANRSAEERAAVAAEAENQRAAVQAAAAAVEAKAENQRAMAEAAAAAKKRAAEEIAARVDQRKAAAEAVRAEKRAATEAYLKTREQEQKAAVAKLKKKRQKKNA